MDKISSYIEEITKTVPRKKYSFHWSVEHKINYFEYLSQKRELVDKKAAILFKLIHKSIVQIVGRY